MKLVNFEKKIMAYLAAEIIVLLAQNQVCNLLLVCQGDKARKDIHG
jgi:hypothetical protein